MTLFDFLQVVHVPEGFFDFFMLLSAFGWVSLFLIVLQIPHPNLFYFLLRLPWNHHRLTSRLQLLSHFFTHLRFVVDFNVLCIFMQLIPRFFHFVQLFLMFLIFVFPFSFSFLLIPSRLIEFFLFIIYVSRCDELRFWLGNLLLELLDFLEMFLELFFGKRFAEGSNFC